MRIKKVHAGRICKRELAKQRDYLLKESIVMLAADLCQDIYDSDGCDGFTEAFETIIELAEEFERRLNWVENGDNLDYLEELEKVETNVRKRLQHDKPSLKWQDGERGIKGRRGKVA